MTPPKIDRTRSAWPGVVNRSAARSGWWLLQLLATWVLVVCNSAWAAVPQPMFPDYQLTTWTAKDGAPVDIWAIAQTADGWLWFGGPTGLHRFDGIRFKRVEIEPAGSNASQAISSLFATKTGQLLIGRFNGGVTILEGGRLNIYRDDAAIGSTVLALTQDLDGFIWAATRKGLARLEGGLWRRVADDWNFPEDRTEALLVDRLGTLWASTTRGVLRLVRGAGRFEPSGVQVGLFRELIEAPDGRAWVADGWNARVLPDQPLGGERDPAANSRSAFISLFDRRGRFWSIAEYDKDAEHLGSPPNGFESISADGKTMIEDRDGNIWMSTVGTEIHRLRRTAFLLPSSRRMASPGFGFAAGNDGVVWMTQFVGRYGAQKTDGVWKFNGALQQLAAPSSGSTIHRSADGTVWVGAKEGIFRLEGERFALAFQFPEPLRGAVVRGIAVDPDGELWVSLVGKGLVRRVGGTWAANGNLTGLPTAEPNVLSYDLTGKLWLGYGDGSVATVDRGNAKVVATADDLRVGAVFSINTDRRVLVAGERGLRLLRGDQLVAVTATGGDVFKSVTGIAQTAGGDVWVNAGAGAVRIPAGQLDGAIVNGAIEVSTELFDSSDGYPGSSAGALGTPLPTISLMPDGTLWLNGDGGIAHIDPTLLEHRASRPRAFVDGLTAEGQPVDLLAGSMLPKGTRNLQFDYTALDYTHPDRLRFRYRLIGYDKEWVEAGARRQGFYTNLGPGRYRFEVQAANESGLTGEAPALVEFEIPPTFIQTRTFVLLCALASMALLALLYQLRVRQITARERAKLQVRNGERERIARELHDTLLQSTQGLILRFQTQTQQIDPDNPVRADLEQTVRLANEVMAEGRDRVQDLRTGDDGSRELSESLAEVGKQLAAEYPVAFRTFIEGHVRGLRRDVKSEAYRIGREALLNAFRHAGAAVIEVQVAYEDRLLRMRVRDDGLGIAPETLAAGGVSSHWGLRGMKERAREIGASLEIWSRTDGGTEVELTIPARIAYEHARHRFNRLPTWPFTKA